MATLTKGKSYTTQELVTNTNLHQAVDSATLGGVEFTDMDTDDNSVVVKSNVAPESPTANQFWFDTDSGDLRQYDGSNWQSAARGYILNNDSSSAALIEANRVIQIQTNGTVPVGSMTSGASPTTMGVSLESIAINGVGLVLDEGIVEILASGTVTRGEHIASGADGKCTGTGTKTVDTIGIALTTGTDVNVKVLLQY